MKVVATRCSVCSTPDLTYTYRDFVISGIRGDLCGRGEIRTAFVRYIDVSTGIPYIVDRYIDDLAGIRYIGVGYVEVQLNKHTAGCGWISDGEGMCTRSVNGFGTDIFSVHQAKHWYLCFFITSDGVITFQAHTRVDRLKFSRGDRRPVVDTSAPLTRRTPPS